MKNQNSYCSVFNEDASETVAYNNPLFPLYVHLGKLSSYPDYSAISHWHMDLEFIIIKKGQMTYNVNGNLINLTENNGIMVNSRQLHYGFSPEHQECEFVCILFSPELFSGNAWFYQNFIEPVIQNFSCPYLYLDNNGWHNAVLQKLDAIYHCSFTDSAPYFDLIGLFNGIFQLLYQNITERGAIPKQESEELSSLKNMISYVEEHFADHITLKDLALAGTCCKSRCNILFKKYLRDTPVSYINKLRLRKSLDLLLESDISITNIALTCGFSGASYYCEIFHRYYGISPFQYRKLYSKI